MNVFISGVAGFIGFSLANELLKKKYIVYGIDNLDNYYSLKLKKARLKILKKKKNFYFHKVDISKKKNLKNYFKNKNFEIIFHFAAQAGVRYSVINPKKYIKSNIEGFKNTLESIKNKNFKVMFYASSSSIYGDTKLFPVKENFTSRPKNLYARSKVLNEKDAKKFSKLFKKKLVGLRFFTIYGEWGRPDMLILKMLSFMKRNKIFELNNNGDHYRDFTYIKDVNKILLKLINKKDFKYKVYNICSSKPVFIKKAVKQFVNITGYNLIKNIKKNKLDVYKTFGDNNKIRKLSKFRKFTKFEKGLRNTIKWYTKLGYKYF